MKKILTILVCEKLNCDIEPPCEETDVLYTDENRSRGEIIKNGIKQAKGKYICLADGEFTADDVSGFLVEADGANADILTFDGGYCFKAAILKGLNLNDNLDRYAAEICAALASKSVAKINAKPFTFTGVHTEYSEAVENNLLKALDEFKKCKAKIPKDVYTFAFDMICARLVTFYISAMLALKRGEIAAEKLIAFDEKLKENIVLYLALEKRFVYESLNKLRSKKFAISYLTKKKFKKILK